MSVVRWMCFGWFLALVNGSWATDGGGMNVVFILSDNQSYYEMSSHGHAVVKTPHLDALAERSLLFPKGYVAAPLCRPSLASMAIYMLMGAVLIWRPTGLFGAKA